MKWTSVHGPIVVLALTGKLKLPDPKHDMIGLHYTVSCLISSIVCGSSSSPPHEYMSLRFIATLCILYMTNSIRFNVLKMISTIQTINCGLMDSCSILSYSRLLTIIYIYIYINEIRPILNLCTAISSAGSLRENYNVFIKKTCSQIG